MIYIYTYVYVYVHIYVHFICKYEYVYHMTRSRGLNKRMIQQDETPSTLKMPEEMDQLTGRSSAVSASLYA